MYIEKDSEQEMEMSPKDMKKVQQLHDELMAMAEKYDMSMDDMLEKCCMHEEEEMEEEEGMGEARGKPEMDRAKIALIIGKMRPKGE